MLRIRAAAADDYDAFARLFPELQVDDPVPSRETWTTELVPTAFVADLEGAVVAYVWFQLYKHEGIIRHLVVGPGHRGHRLGERLLIAAADVMRARGLERWSLNVKPDNASALRLYHRVGMQLSYESQALRFDWSLVERLPRSTQPLFAGPVVPSEEPSVERHQSLPDGTFATARALPGRVLFSVTQDDCPVGAAVFVPGFPGAYPFRADSLEVARVLLKALEPFALPEPPYMQVVVEGQPRLASGLREHGATVRLDIQHLAGPIPAA